MFSYICMYVCMYVLMYVHGFTHLQLRGDVDTM